MMLDQDIAAVLTLVVTFGVVLVSELFQKR